MSSEGSRPPTVVGHDEVGDGSVDVDRWARLAEQSLVTEGVTGPAELTLVFVPAAEMARLNAAHMGQTGPTDVLAFPLDAGEPAATGSDGRGVPRLLGDVVVCPEVAAANATAAGRTIDDELALLVVHGLLHVLGHDHAEAGERSRMQARERALLALHHAEVGA